MGGWWGGTNLGDDLELLALAELGLGDGLLEAGEGLVVEFLIYSVSIAPNNIPGGGK
jgi:hypothetical protein